MRIIRERSYKYNEELAAINEELAATNEEYLAANEELGAANEELATTNEELLEAEENIRRSEKLFRSIALNIPGSLIIVIDRNHRYVTIEGDIMEKMGYDRHRYEGKHPAEISPERYEASKSLYDRVLAGEKFSVERKAETSEYYLIHFVPLKNDDDLVESALIIALDINEIKQAEEKSAKLAAIVETTDDAIISKTTESVVTSWNAAAEWMFGYIAEEMIGQTIYKIIPEDREDEEPRILARLRTGKRVDHFETKRLTKDGQLLDVYLTISRLWTSRNRSSVCRRSRGISPLKNRKNNVKMTLSVW
ncbi:PAS domain S-box protein [Mucilaginibacter sabulilitoris]|uniref:histidine kinase n=1 Tax=Mucilaginibacter sabulilitoris TaxID=1173583 RepID=A0ABZ0TX89_9SPHI|nr:PAS domain S-box protein [Mucilaginibacter sabulilitoris]WPU95740.1 PAS domain S-box protein [Mucilaginibacter sabulilitoris]